jgi:hypothetical protein
LWTEIVSDYSLGTESSDKPLKLLCYQ